MLRSFRDKDTEAVWQRRKVKAFGPELTKAAYMKLAILDAAGNINDLRVPPGNRLEKPTGDRDGQRSIRINDQYRICFVWKDDGAEDVELTDYHQRGVHMADFAPVHPGEILRIEFLEPLGISTYRLAKAIDVPQTRLSEILRGRRAITADTALRLSKALGLSDMFWVNMQARYDAEMAKDALADRLAAIHPVA